MSSESKTVASAVTVARSRSAEPRWIRAGRAGAYLGMNRNRFNAEVRPHLTEIPIGQRGIAFDRLELDAWADQYVARNGRPAQQQEGRLCRESTGGLPGSMASGTSISKSKAMDAFAKA